jgi:hypothetical protein
MIGRLSTLQTFNRANEESAQIILSDAERFGGEGSGAVRWARTFLERLNRERQAAVGPLFGVSR